MRNDDNPVAGKGEEMMPEGGFSFFDDDDTPTPDAAPTEEPVSAPELETESEQPNADVEMESQPEPVDAVTDVHVEEEPEPSEASESEEPALDSMVTLDEVMRMAEERVLDSAEAAYADDADPNDFATAPIPPVMALSAPDEGEATPETELDATAEEVQAIPDDEVEYQTEEKEEKPMATENEETQEQPEEQEQLPEGVLSLEDAETGELMESAQPEFREIGYDETTITETEGPSFGVLSIDAEAENDVEFENDPAESIQPEQRGIGYDQYTDMTPESESPARLGVLSFGDEDGEEEPEFELDPTESVQPEMRGIGYDEYSDMTPYQEPSEDEPAPQFGVLSIDDMESASDDAPFGMEEALMSPTEGNFERADFEGEGNFGPDSEGIFGEGNFGPDSEDIGGFERVDLEGEGNFGPDREGMFGEGNFGPDSEDMSGFERVDLEGEGNFGPDSISDLEGEGSWREIGGIGAVAAAAMDEDSGKNLRGHVDPDEVVTDELESIAESDSGLGGGFYVSDDELAAMAGEPTGSVSVPPPEAMRGAPLFSEESMFRPGALEGIEGADAPELSGDLDADKKLLGFFVTDERLNELWGRADKAAAMVNEKVNDVTTARELLNQIRSAKTLIMSGREQYEEAERAVNEVMYRLSYNDRSKEWTGPAVRRILSYEVAWGLFLAFGFTFLPSFASQFVATGGGFVGLNVPFPDFITPNDVFNAVGAMMWGGIGGIVGALYNLWRYVSRQNFNPQYSIWYYLQPLLGFFVGMFIFIFLKLGVVVSVGGTNADITSPFFVYALGFIAGFQQNVLYDIVRQVLKLFEIGNREEEGTNDAAG